MKYSRLQWLTGLCRNTFTSSGTQTRPPPMTQKSAADATVMPGPQRSLPSLDSIVPSFHFTFILSLFTRLNNPGVPFFFFFGARDRLTPPGGPLRVPRAPVFQPSHWCLGPTGWCRRILQWNIRAKQNTEEAISTNICRLFISASGKLLLLIFSCFSFSREKRRGKKPSNNQKGPLKALNGPFKKFR